MNIVGQKGWMPGMLVFKAASLGVGSSTTMTVSIDKNIKFKAFAMTGFAHQAGAPGTTGYFTVDSFVLGSYARKIIYGSPLHSNYFNRFTAMPVRFEGDMWENTDIQIGVTNVSSAISIDVFVVINGLQMQIS